MKTLMGDAIDHFNALAQSGGKCQNLADGPGCSTMYKKDGLRISICSSQAQVSSQGSKDAIPCAGSGTSVVGSLSYFHDSCPGDAALGTVWTSEHTPGSEPMWLAMASDSDACGY